MNPLPDFLSPAVSRAIQLAKKLAAFEQSLTVEARHVAHALLGGETEGLAAAHTRQHGYLTSEPFMTLPDLESVQATTDTLSRTVASSLRESKRFANEVTGEILLCVLMGHDLELQNSLKSGGLDTGAFREAILGTHAEPIAIVEPLVIAESSEEFQVARIIDANINRSREAARVLEDYARFSLNDAGLSQSFKWMRHFLREIPERLGLRPGLGRDTPSDVGTSLTTEAEFRRADAQQIVSANAKRLQEALRSLEEYGKLLNPAVAREIESTRYESYTLEVAMTSVRQGQDRLVEVRLYWLFTGSACKVSPENAVSEAIAGGVQMIQLREKSLTDGQLLARARQLRAWTRKTGVLFIVNDRPDIAKLVEADGVHLGQTDLPVSAARAILGRDAIIGVSTHDIDQVRQAVRDGANYIGVGPTFPSTTKDFSDLAGLDFVRAATAETELPAFVLGGVTAKNVSQVIQAGGRRVAVSAAISGSEYPRQAATDIASQL